MFIKDVQSDESSKILPPCQKASLSLFLKNLWYLKGSISAEYSRFVSVPIDIIDALGRLSCDGDLSFSWFWVYWHCLCQMKELHFTSAHLRLILPLFPWMKWILFVISSKKYQLTKSAPFKKGETFCSWGCISLSDFIHKTWHFWINLLLHVGILTSVIKVPFFTPTTIWSYISHITIPNIETVMLYSICSLEFKYNRRSAQKWSTRGT